MATAIDFYNFYDEPPDYQTLRGWHGAAIAIGIVIIGLGIFGLIGLLQAHGYLSLPQKLVTIFQDIDPTSPYLALWAILFGGISVGSTLIGANASSLEELRLQEKLDQFLEQQNFTLSSEGKLFKPLQPTTYHRSQNQENSGEYIIIIKTTKSVLYESKFLSKIESEQFMAQLDGFGYRDAPSCLLEHFEPLLLGEQDYLDITPENMKKLPNRSLTVVAHRNNQSRKHILIHDNEGKGWVSPAIFVEELPRWIAFLNSLDQYQVVDMDAPMPENPWGPRYGRVQGNLIIEV